MSMAYLGVTLEFIKSVLEIMVYIAIIYTALKASQALHIYIRKNEK